MEIVSSIAFLLLAIVLLVGIIKEILSKDNDWFIKGFLVGVSMLLGIVIYSTSNNILGAGASPSIEEQEIIADSLLLDQTAKDLAFADSVYQYIVFLNIKHPEVVMKQAILESGNFKSKIFKENNNIFGMKVPYKRPNTTTGSNRGHAVYENWKESVIDYALYQTYTAKGMTKEQYIRHLGNSYAEDPHYKSKIK